MAKNRSRQHESADPRAIALEVLAQVDSGGASDRCLDRALRRVELDDRDRRLATEIVYGTLRRQATLDRLLEPHCRRPLADLDAPVRAALRIGVYQHLFLDSVPEHAAVDTAVEAVKRHLPRAAALVNGILRAWLRTPRLVPEEPTADLATRLDVPAWWAGRWRDAYGAEVAERWFHRALEPVPMVLRPHPRRVNREHLPEALESQGIRVEPCEFARGALRVLEGNPLRSRLFHEGAFALRGEAGQLICPLLHARAGHRVLDACCGRGGKGVQCAEDSPGAWIVAIDIERWRAVACRDEARRAGTDEIRVLCADLSRPPPLGVQFDRILIDAPCSGLGTVRRRPEIKWRIEPEHLPRLAERQLRILTSCASRLAPGGLLVYATCSTEPEENEEVVEALLATRSDLRAVPVQLDAGTDPLLVGDDGYFRTFPLFPDLEGFFAAAIEQRSAPWRYRDADP